MFRCVIPKHSSRESRVPQKKTGGPIRARPGPVAITQWARVTSETHQPPDALEAILGDGEFVTGIAGVMTPDPPENDPFLRGSHHGKKMRNTLKNKGFPVFHSKQASFSPKDLLTPSISKMNFGTMHVSVAENGPVEEGEGGVVCVGTIVI